MTTAAPGEYDRGIGAGTFDWNLAVYERPAPERVAALEQSHGFHACIDRWGFLSEDMLRKLASKGRRMRRQREHLK